LDKTLIEDRLNALFADRRPTRWVTRARPKIDRIACPWLIRRFLDPDAVVLYAPADQVFETARREQAEPFDIPGARISHRGELCSFDALIEDFGLEQDAGLSAMRPIVRGADTDRHELAPEAAGLHALSLGLALTFDDDLELLDRGLIVYDALYAWACRARGERHAWTP